MKTHTNYQVFFYFIYKRLNNNNKSIAIPLGCVSERMVMCTSFIHDIKNFPKNNYDKMGLKGI